MAKTSARVAARERAREVRSRNAAATKERAGRIEQLQTEFFEAEALRDDAAQAVELHELDAARRVADLLELGLAVDEVAALLDTDAKTMRGLGNRANAAARTPAEPTVSTAPELGEGTERHGRGPHAVSEAIGIAAADPEVGAIGPRAQSA